MAEEKAAQKAKEKIDIEIQPEVSLDVLPKEGFIQLVQDALLVGNFEQAEKYLEEFRLRFGEIPEYIHTKAGWHRVKGNHAQYYQLVKKLYFEFPVYMMNNREYETVRDSVLLEKIEKAKVHWNLLINFSSKAVAFENQESKAEEKEAIQGKIDEEMDQVIAAYKEVLEIEPMHIQAIKGMLYCFSEKGDIEETENFKEKLEKAENYWNDQINKRSQACLSAAKKIFGEKQYDLAIQIINLGLTTSPMHRDLLLLKADVLKELKRFRDAAACVDLVLKKYPNDSVSSRMKKDIQAGRVNETLQLGLLRLQEAEQKLPGSDLQKLLREAQECFFEVLDLEPNNLKALIGLYQTQVLTDNPIKARKTLGRIKEIDPTIEVEKKTAPLPNPHDLGEEPCFVASRLFGNEAPETVKLRHFRESFLKALFPGRILIRLYRRLGPSLAALHERNPLIFLLRESTRIFCRFL